MLQWAPWCSMPQTEALRDHLEHMQIARVSAVMLERLIAVPTSSTRCLTFHVYLTITEWGHCVGASTTILRANATQLPQVLQMLVNQSSTEQALRE